MFKILIKDLVLYGYHGVNESEKKKGQYFVYNLEIKLKKNYKVEDDAIENTLNYSEAIRILKRTNNDNRFDLLETLSYTCAAELFMMSELIEEIKITVEKINPPIRGKLKSVGVTLKLKRKDFLHYNEIVDRENNKNNIKDKLKICYLSLGSNLGDRLGNLKQAVSILSDKDILRVLKISSIYETEPMYFKKQSEFYNIVIKTELESGLSPFVLLGYLKDIEYEMGRQESSFKNSPRIIDIDILDVEDTVIDSDILKLPHDRMKERNFVLVPLSEIAPDYIIDGIKIKDYIEKCNYQDKIVRIKENIVII